MTEKQFVKYNGKQIQVINGSLDLRNNGIKDVNDIEGINNLKSIQELYLDNNQLITLPNWIENFTSLLKLNLKGNEIKIFPKCIVDLESLQVLQMDNNQLESLPESIGNLSTLQILSLSNNKLNSLPEAIGKLTSLQELRLTNNQLTNLPKSIINLSLKKILIGRNQFTTHSKDIQKWLDRNEPKGVVSNRFWMKILQVLKTTRAENEVIEILQEWIALIPDAWEDYKEKVWKSFNILYVDKYKTLHQDILDALFLADALINYGKRQHNKMISCYGLDIKATIISRGYEKIFWETAKEMFNNIIKVSPDYCSINYYEMVCAKLNILNLEDQPIIPSKYYSDIFEFLEIEPIIEPIAQKKIEELELQIGHSVPLALKEFHLYYDLIMYKEGMFNDPGIITPGGIMIDFLPSIIKRLSQENTYDLCSSPYKTSLEILQNIQSKDSYFIKDLEEDDPGVYTIDYEEEDDKLVNDHLSHLIHDILFEELITRFSVYYDSNESFSKTEINDIAKLFDQVYFANYSNDSITISFHTFIKKQTYLRLKIIEFEKYPSSRPKMVLELKGKYLEQTQNILKELMKSIPQLKNEKDLKVSESKFFL